MQPATHPTQLLFHLHACLLAALPPCRSILSISSALWSLTPTCLAASLPTTPWETAMPWVRHVNVPAQQHEAARHRASSAPAHARLAGLPMSITSYLGGG